MKITENKIPVMTIEEFADKHGLEMEIHERKRAVGAADRYYAHFKSCDLMEGGMLVGTFGNGSTPEEAIQNYAGRITLGRICIEAYAARKEIEVPRLNVTQSERES